ncbi:MAG: DNA cytosine methyltransferase [DPANN group archaeon]|nr:DNA cytosine methyltransferase [DPANN group archaeon]
MCAEDKQLIVGKSIESNNKYNVIDLFSGCGGLSLGFSDAGFNIVLSNELNQDVANK